MSFAFIRVRVALNDSLNNRGDSLKPGDISVAKIVKPFTINIDHARDAAVSAKEGYDDFRPGSRTAGYMAGKFFYVRHDNSLTGRICMSANALVEIDAGASKRPLKRSED